LSEAHSFFFSFSLSLFLSFSLSLFFSFSLSLFLSFSLSLFLSFSLSFSLSLFLSESPIEFPFKTGNSKQERDLYLVPKNFGNCREMTEKAFYYATTMQG
jgi:hypothetical protein